MSLNHLVDPTIPTPRYDIYVNDIDCNDVQANEVKATNLIASASVTAPNITATTELFMAEQNNYNDTLEIYSPFLNPILIDEGENDYALGDLVAYVTSRKVAGNGYIDTYKLSWEGAGTVDGNAATFDFKALVPYDRFVSINGHSQLDSDPANVNIYTDGIIADFPTNPANDFAIIFDEIPVTSFGFASFQVEIQLYRNP
jgi:hypothetical protein